jgi:hypothetical protein
MLKFVFHLALQTNSPCGKLAKAWGLDLQSDTDAIVESLYRAIEISGAQF